MNPRVEAEPEELVIEARAPDRRCRSVAFASALATIGAAAWAYVEYLGRARAPLLSLALAAVFFGLAATVLCTFRSSFPFETVQAPRPKPPAPEPPIDFGVGARRGAFAILAAAATGLAAIVLLPLRSLGGAPGPTLRATAWRRGVRLVTPDGAPLRPADVPTGGVAAVLPGGALDDATSAAVLVRLRGSSELRAFSRICTHAGCAVCVFRVEESQLVCPCHYSVFDAAGGGRVVSGPASRALAELPLAIDEHGFLVADGDYRGPIGPRLG